MPEKGDLVVLTAAPSTVYEIVRITRNPVAALLLSGSPGAYSLTEVPQANFGQYSAHAPAIEVGQRWADDRGRVYEVVAKFTFAGEARVAYTPLDEGSLNVVKEAQFRAAGALVVE